MKRILAIFLTVMMLFSLAACGNNGDEPAGSDNPGVSQNGDKGGEENWMDAYKMSNLVIPEGATVSDAVLYSKTNRDITRDTAFTDDEIAAFAQSVFENCGNPYKSGWDSEKNEAIKIELASVEDAKGLDEYLWKYEENGVNYGVRIYFGMEGTLGFEKYQS